MLNRFRWGMPAILPLEEGRFDLSGWPLIRWFF